MPSTTTPSSVESTWMPRYASLILRVATLTTPIAAGSLVMPTDATRLPALISRLSANLMTWLKRADTQEGQIVRLVHAGEFRFQRLAGGGFADELAGQVVGLGEHPAVRIDGDAETGVLSVALNTHHRGQMRPPGAERFDELRIGAQEFVRLRVHEGGDGEQQDRSPKR